MIGHASPAVGAVSDPSARPDLDALDRMFSPRSVAIIGASRDPKRIGGLPIANLLAAGFQGSIYPINPGATEIQGRKAYRSVTEIGEEIDLAIISLPADEVVDQIRACCAANVRSIVVFSAGFAELGESGKQAQLEITRLARQHGVRILGPNCIGFFNVAARTPLTFISSVPDHLIAGRNIGVVTQSSGYGAHLMHILGKRLDMSLGHWVTTGNEADLEFGDVLNWMVENVDIDVVVGYIEGIRSKAALLRGLHRAAEKRKPIILVKVGSTDAGAAAAASHTASLAGAETAYEALFEKYGVLRARSTEEAQDMVYAVLGRRYPQDGNVCIFTSSGGLGVQFADYAHAAGLDLPAVAPNAQEKILAMVPYGSARNPVDVTAQLTNDPSLLGQSLETVFDEGGFGSAVAYLGPAAKSPTIGGPLFDSVSQVARDHPDKVVVLAMIAPPEVVERYEGAGCLVFEEPARAVRALGALHQLQRFWESFEHAPPAIEETFETGLDRRNKPVDTEVAAKSFLADCGIPVPPEQLVVTADQAAEAATLAAGPVAIKVVSRDIQHKTEVGGVALSVKTAEDAFSVFTEMMENVRAKRPDAKIDGLLVTPMISGGVECIVGVSRDPVFGPMVMVGLGGVAVELLKDVQWALAPVGEPAAHAMLRKLKSFPLLDGYRGRAKADVAALAKVVARLSQLAAANTDIISAEINPVLVFEEGRGVLALDAVILTEEKPLD